MLCCPVGSVETHRTFDRRQRISGATEKGSIVSSETVGDCQTLIHIASARSNASELKAAAREECARSKLLSYRLTFVTIMPRRC